MRIGILSRNAQLYSTRRLVNAARERGHEVRVIDTLSVAVEVGLPNDMPPSTKVVSPTAVGLSRTTQMPEVDAIIPRIGASITPYGVAVVRQFEARGTLSTASADAIGQSRDKLASLQIMDSAGLPIPRTAVIGQPDALYTAVQAVGGVPVVIKLITGTQGRGVVLAPNLATAAAVMRSVRNARRQALIQEYVKEATGRDLRIIVVGGRCVAAMERSAAEGEFRANLHRGGTAVVAELDNTLRQLAISAARAHGLHVAGVDLIQSKRGPLILEVNSSPGLEGIETITGEDVAGAIVAYVEQIAFKHERRRRRTR